MALLCMCKALPALRGKQVIVTSLGDITIVVLTLKVGNYIRRAHMNLEAFV